MCHLAKAQPLPRSFSPDQLIQFYEMNKEEADRLTGQRLQIAGTVASVEQGAVSFKAYTKDNIKCVWGEPTVDLKQFKGREVIVVGRSKGRGRLGNVTLEECQIAKMAAAQTQNDSVATTHVETPVDVHVERDKVTTSESDGSSEALSQIGSSQTEDLGLPESPVPSADATMPERVAQSDGSKVRVESTPSSDVEKPWSVFEIGLGLIVLLCLAALNAFTKIGEQRQGESAEVHRSMGTCRRCFSSLLRCQSCHSVGCYKETCRNHKFDGTRCCVCNGTGSYST